MCPSRSSDDADAVDITLRRGSSFTLRATVRHAGICVDPEERAAREGEVSRAKAFVGPNEAAYLAYADAAAALCEPHPPSSIALGDIARLPGFVMATASCTRADAAFPDNLPSASPSPQMGSRSHVGHFRPGPGRYFGLDRSPDGVHALEVEVDVGGRSVLAVFYFASTARPDASP